MVAHIALCFGVSLTVPVAGIAESLCRAPSFAIITCQLECAAPPRVVCLRVPGRRLIVLGFAVDFLMGFGDALVVLILPLARFVVAGEISCMALESVPARDPALIIRLAFNRGRAIPTMPAHIVNAAVIAVRNNGKGDQQQQGENDYAFSHMRIIPRND